MYSRLLHAGLKDIEFVLGIKSNITQQALEKKNSFFCCKKGLNLSNWCISLTVLHALKSLYVTLIRKFVHIFLQKPHTEDENVHQTDKI